MMCDTLCLDVRRLTSLASFIGHVCRAYPDMELTALLQYLVNQLRARESHDLVVLKDLISTMTVCGWELGYILRHVCEGV